MSWRERDSRHRLLLAMAKDAERLQAQAERLTDLKKRARVKYHEISTAVGVTERQVQRWFAGDGDINDENLLKLAAFFNTTADYIEYGETPRERGGTPDPFTGENIEVGELLAEVKRLTQVVEELLLPRQASRTEQPESQDPHAEDQRREPPASAA